MNRIDPVFGEVAYEYGWTKPMEVRLGDTSYRIACVASAYKGQDITESQQEQYRAFLDNQEELEKRIMRLLQQYYRSLKGPDASLASLQAGVKPTELVFQRDGSYGMLLDCDWDVDNGIVVRLYPEEQVGPQDMFL